MAVDHKARRPLQARSQERFEQIVSALEQLLQVANIEDVSFNDIAAKAQITPASINYLFPSMAALQVELTQRYFKQSADFIRLAQNELEAQRNPRWQEWLSRMAESYRDHCNQNRHVSEIILGPALHHDIRRAAATQNLVLAKSLAEAFHEVFEMPTIPMLAERIAMSMECIDALWTRAYSLHGFVDDETVKRGVDIQIAYLRTILPEEMTPRQTEANAVLPVAGPPDP